MGAASVAGERVFTYAAPGLRFGPGASGEIWFDLQKRGIDRVLVVSDAGVVATGHPDRIEGQLRDHGIASVRFDDVSVEPTDISLRAAAEFARTARGGDGSGFGAVVAIGGGSVIDTAKAMNLLCTNSGALEDYLNSPIGKAESPTNSLLPMIAIPTTTGTGSESTTICVLDVVSLGVKTGISDPALRPTLAVVDPDLTATQPSGVLACAGLDVLSHALESYTARPFAAFDAKRPEQRVPYCGSNPIADMWSAEALRLLAEAFVPAVRGEEGANHAMALAATFAGLGFGNAGVHVPHANAYPIAGMVPAEPGFHPADYPRDHAMVPHGMAVALTAPEAFRFTFDAAPERHVRAAELLDPTGERAGGAQGADRLPVVLRSIMRDVGMPNGLAEVGYGSGDVDGLVEGSLKQERLLAVAPVTPRAEDLATIFADSLDLW